MDNIENNLVKDLPPHLPIFGIGTDLVAVSRVKKIWDHYGLVFARRILSSQEMEAFQDATEPVSFLSKRFAAKEAISKAMGTGFRPDGFWFTDISVHNDALGKPYLQYSARMQSLLEKQGITESYISLSDEKDFALAFVVMVGKERKATEF